MRWRRLHTGERYIASTAARRECEPAMPDGRKCVRSSLPRNVAMALCMSAGMRACMAGSRVISAFKAGW